MLEAEPPNQVQQALDAVREDLVNLKASFDYWSMCVDAKDVLDRLENWHFNTLRHMEVILQG